MGEIAAWTPATDEPITEVGEALEFIASLADRMAARRPLIWIFVEEDSRTIAELIDEKPLLRRAAGMSLAASDLRLGRKRGSFTSIYPSGKES